jgi:hypothetical protein
MMPMNIGSMIDGNIVRKETGTGGLAGGSDEGESAGNSAASQRRLLGGVVIDAFTPPSAPPRQAVADPRDPWSS